MIWFRAAGKPAWNLFWQSPDPGSSEVVHKSENKETLLP
jgi:hypothetical protein